MLLIHRRFHAIRPRAAALIALALAAPLTSCSDPLGPNIDQQSTPFYYYENQKIYLRVDGTRLTAEPEVEGDTVTLRTVLTQAGVAPDSIRPLGFPGHWFVHLPPRTSARRAENAARQMRLDAGVRFASAVYMEREGNCPLFMIDRLAVQFRSGTDADAIEQLNAATGVHNGQADGFGTWWFEYPARMAATPLELAAHYHRQRIVDWAEADRINGCLRLDASQAP